MTTEFLNSLLSHKTQACRIPCCRRRNKNPICELFESQFPLLFFVQFSSSEWQRTVEKVHTYFFLFITFHEV